VLPGEINLQFDGIDGTDGNKQVSRAIGSCEILERTVEEAQYSHVGRRQIELLSMFPLPAATSRLGVAKKTICSGKALELLKLNADRTLEEFPWKDTSRSQRPLVQGKTLKELPENWWKTAL
jgi:hypothetical protein